MRAHYVHSNVQGIVEDHRAKMTETSSELEKALQVTTIDPNFCWHT